MSARHLAWSLWALTLALGVGIVVFSVLNRDTDVTTTWPPLLEALTGLVVLTFMTIGAIVASRRPRNPIGWILIGAAVPSALGGFGEGYGVYALYTDPGSLPAGDVFAWLAAWAYIPGLLAAPALLFLLFPDGRVPGRRWRLVLWLIVAATTAATVDAALAPVLEDAPFEGLESPLPFATSALEPLSFFGWPGMTLGLVLSAAAMIVRLRRSRGVERQQLKWVASAAALLPVVSVVGVGLYYGGVDELGSFLVVFAFFPIPLAAGYAILRHRLYDIDLVINRALVYGALTAILAGAYLGLVLLLGQALAPLTSESDLAIALSTLAVAALFRPVRGRVQALVDRRFYRRKYDAARTLESFGARLRAETDLDALRGDLTGVVRETMQPAHVSLWLRRPGGGG